MPLAFCTAPVRLPSSTRVSVHTHIRCCSAVPRNLNEAVKVCARALDAAAAGGARRMRVRALVPGLNPALEDSFPYNEKLLLMLTLSLVRTSDALAEAPRVALLFKSAGTAAAATNACKSSGERLPDHVDIGVYDDARALPEKIDGAVRVIVNPVSARGNPVVNEIERAVNRDPGATWVLLNPDFDADRSAMGVRELDRRADFLSQFVDVF
eukprot:IDg20992t1